MSKFELEFEAFFKKKKISFIRNDRQKFGTPDFSFKGNGTEIVLFLHGCYWHGHNCKEWKLNSFALSRQATAKYKDKEVISYYMNKPNFVYMRCWECEYKDNKNYHLERIYNSILQF